LAKILELERVSMFRGTLQVLREISLDLERGDSAFIVGRNGAGKTAIIKGLMGLLPVKSGKIMFSGQDVTNLAAYKRARLGIGYLPDDMGVVPDLTLEEHIKMAAWVSHQPLEEIKKTIFPIFPELERLMNRRGIQLSGGERRMLAISRALALKPSLLLLDEALEGLAPVAVTRLTDAIAMIVKKMGLTVFAAESNIALASKMASKIYAIERGEILYQGDPKKIFEQEDIMRIIRG
jgi:ABC-type branched-subunit amino acid transport system ATPase component